MRSGRVVGASRSNYVCAAPGADLGIDAESGRLAALILHLSYSEAHFVRTDDAGVTSRFSTSEVDATVNAALQDGQPLEICL
jgi:hypothetical protein